jgi:hypothetical protein
VRRGLAVACRNLRNASVERLLSRAVSRPALCVKDVAEQRVARQREPERSVRATSANGRCGAWQRWPWVPRVRSVGGGSLVALTVPVSRAASEDEDGG